MVIHRNVLDQDPRVAKAHEISLSSTLLLVALLKEDLEAVLVLELITAMTIKLAILCSGKLCRPRKTSIAN